MARRVLVAAVLALGLLAGAGAHASARKVPQRFFGVNWDRRVTFASDQSTRGRQWAHMAKWGVESARTPFEWYIAQPGENGPFKFRRIDNRVQLAVSHGIDVLPVVIAAPPWARRTVADAEAPPAGTENYCKYLRALIGRYGPNGTFWSDHPQLPKHPIRQWQIWNEPSEQYQWTIQDTEDWAPGYGKLLRASYDAIKQADPGAKVVLAGFPGPSWAHLDHLYKAGHIEGHFDVAAIHPFTRRPKDTVELVKRFKATLRAHGDASKPVWATEVAIPAGEGRGTPGDLNTTDRGMAKYVTGAFEALVHARKKDSTRVERAYWYTWASAYRNKNEAFDYTGLYVYRHKHHRDVLVPRPALRRYRKVALAYEGCRKDATARCR